MFLELEFLFVDAVPCYFVFLYTASLLEKKKNFVFRKPLFCLPLVDLVLTFWELGFRFVDAILLSFRVFLYHLFTINFLNISELYFCFPFSCEYFFGHSHVVLSIGLISCSCVTV